MFIEGVHERYWKCNLLPVAFFIIAHKQTQPDDSILSISWAVHER